MQVLVDTGVENSTTEGLKLIRGKTYKLKFKKTKKISILVEQNFFTKKS